MSDRPVSARMVTALVVGAGQRGFGYAQYALDKPELLQIVGVADPSDFARQRAQQAFSIPVHHTYQDWTVAAEQVKFADCVIIATPDRKHKEPAIAFAKLGYHILLEKPMAVTEEDCEAIVAVCKASGVMLSVCHVLRYYPNFLKIRELIDSGTIGDVCFIRHTEPVGFWHFAHSFVRGNWRRTDESSFSLLAKCCHDMDLISYWMGDRRCTKVSSFGSLMHFKKADKPPGASSHCLDCDVETSCPYSAKKIYLDRAQRMGNCGSWPNSVVTSIPDIESLRDHLKTGPYGRCVYECDNDVVTNQAVNMQFDNGATATLHMVAFTEKLCSRETVISGTKGEITCNHTGPLRVFDFLKQSSSLYDPESESPVPAGSRVRGHSGADFYLIDAFVKAVSHNDPSFINSGPEDTLRSHQLVFAAERSRIENIVVNL